MNAPTAQHAPEATVDALMYDLRERGLPALSIRTNQARFAALSPEQSKTIIERLHKVRARYPAITDDLLLIIDRCRHA